MSEVGGGGEEGEEFGGRLGSPPFGAWGRVEVVDHDVDEDSEGLEGGNEGEEEADDLLDPDFGDEVQREGEVVEGGAGELEEAFGVVELCRPGETELEAT